ncbi:MAG: hypothetical protein AVDCRST_MAG89-1809, partial [uncultured Gemmatimonadetes bacterium]
EHRRAAHLCGLGFGVRGVRRLPGLFRVRPVPGSEGGGVREGWAAAEVGPVEPGALQAGRGAVAGPLATLAPSENRGLAGMPPGWKPALLAPDHV